ncbi:hypothetical protein [Streptomyces sp. NBC_00503]|uniref:hypothetical protein n=1 Tax=Streptomyces sp. NBC_00503 TaxID=2903659 RepID=UPI002E81AE10|nr:hypothetical protein [Streptomyces sp. NBC_00503]WUD82129.1 hypothetical protein OG490_17140 [Streptomyces sp. NBC_00503]
MEAIIASAIAVVGTLLGSGVTFAFQQRVVTRGQEFTRSEKLRQERLDAYTSYAGALVNFRRTLVHLWFCTTGQRSGRPYGPYEDPAVVKARSYDLRSSAQEALFRLQMLTADEALSTRAQALLSEISVVHRTESRAEFQTRRDRTRQGISDLVTAAKRQL